MRKGSYFLASGLFVAGLMVGELHAAAAMDMQLADAVRRGDRDAVRQLIKSDRKSTRLNSSHT